MMTPCAHCIHRSRIWGMLYCLLGEWSGEANEKICARYRRDEK